MSDALHLLAAAALLATSDSTMTRTPGAPASVSLESPAVHWTRGIDFSDLPTEVKGARAVSPFEHLQAPSGWNHYLKAGACFAAFVTASATDNGQNVSGCDMGFARVVVPRPRSPHTVPAPYAVAPRQE